MVDEYLTEAGLGDSLRKANFLSSVHFPDRSRFLVADRGGTPTIHLAVDVPLR
jgi:hypothetical protein